MREAFHTPHEDRFGSTLMAADKGLYLKELNLRFLRAKKADRSKTGNLYLIFLLSLESLLLTL